MTAWRVFLRRLTGHVGRRRRERALDEELQTHLELLVDEYLRRGLSEDQARTAARRTFGGVTQMKEAHRDQRGFPVVDHLLRDVRYGLRVLWRSPGFAATSVLSLAVAIGATTSVYAVVDAIFFQSMRVTRPDELVIVRPWNKTERWFLPNPIFEDLRTQQHALAGMAAIADQSFQMVTFEEKSSGYVQASLVSGSYFSLLGLSAELGRLLDEHDDQIPQADSCAAVLSYQFWSSRFQRDPGVLGRRLRTGQADCVVVGVTPRTFTSHLSGYVPDLWLPLRPLSSRRSLDNHFGGFFTGIIGRLRPGLTAAQGEADLTSVYQRIQRAEPLQRGDPNNRIDPKGLRIQLLPAGRGLDVLRQEFGTSLRTLVALVGIAVLLAGLNVANLALARGLSRTAEIETREALGASRVRVLSQLVTEGALIVLAGAVVGIAGASIAAPRLAALFTLPYRTIAIPMTPNYRIAGVATLVASALTLLVAVLPALRLGRNLSLRPAVTRWATESRARQRMLRGLVVGQLAMSLLLVTAAGLLVRTLVGISRIDPGFNPERVLVFDVRDETLADSDPALARLSRAARYAMLSERLRAIPGVEAAGLSWLGLFGGSDLRMAISYVGQTERRPGARVDYVSPGYFDTVGMRVVQGRGFLESDGAQAPPVAVINEAMARLHFKKDALGRQFSFDGARPEDPPFTVVGVVRDSKYNDLRETETGPMMWLPFAHVPVRWGAQSITVRVAPGAAGTVTPRVREILSSIDGTIPIRRTTTLSALVAGTLARERLILGFSLGFGGLAVALAAIGLYGTLAQAVARRRRELGIRLALGASPVGLARMVIASAAWLVVLGTLLGLPLVLVSARGLQVFLFQVSPTDPAVIASSIGLVAIVALLAAYLPARRAAALDPLEVLRNE